MATTMALAVNDLPGGPGVRQMDFQTPATQIAAQQHWLHVMMMVICGVICLAVFGVMFYSIIKHRKSKGFKPANFHESIAVEIAWTLVPFLIVIGMGAMATKTVVAQKDTTNADVTIKATGYQWKWGYDYLKGEGEGISFLQTLDTSQRAMSDSGKAEGDTYLLKVDNPLVVPVGKKIRIITTANDVIHAWMIPAFGVKQDAIPASCATHGSARNASATSTVSAPNCAARNTRTCRSTSRWCRTPSTPRGSTAEKKKLAALADDPNKEWKLADLIARGEKVYANNCAACHQANGKGAGPIKPIDGSPVVLDADRGKQVAVLLNGQNNGAMPAWKQLSDTRHRRGHHVHQERLGQQDRPTGAAG